MKPINEWPPAVRPCASNPPEGSVGIVLPLRDHLKFFKLCFHSILSFTDYRFMLTLVDNMSGFQTRQYLESLRRNHPVNVLQYQQTHAPGAEWNLGLRFMFAFSSVHYGVILTQEVILEPLWLSRLVRALEEEPKAALLVPRSNHDTLSTPAFCMIFRRAAYERLAGFNETFLSGKDTASDFIDRAEMSGFRASWGTQVYVHHFTRSGARLEPEAAQAEQTPKEEAMSHD